MVQRLQHHDQIGASIAFLEHTRQIVVHLDGLHVVDLLHILHHSTEPIEGALLSSHPVEVRLGFPLGFPLGFLRPLRRPRRTLL